ncbi:MAG: hypothetical protein WC459_03240 [Patescibacteria group bacterium]
MELRELPIPMSEADKENFHVAGRNLEDKIPIVMQDIYWQMDAMRLKDLEKMNPGELNELLKKVHEMGTVVNNMKETEIDDDRHHYLGMINDELSKLSLKLQMAVRREGKKQEK